jgi:outer membrane immunogenic protein
MKRIFLGSVAAMTLVASAQAADLPRKTYPKAPPAPSASNWTGFYLFGGAGYGMWEADQQTVSGLPAFLGGGPRHPVRLGGRGYFGTVGGGYDWQLNSRWVAGVFADAQFGDINGTVDYLSGQFVGSTKNKLNYAGGARLGYLVAPNVLSYVNGGYSHAEFSHTTLLPNDGSSPTFQLPKQSFDGWFIGGGVENSLDMFGISAPGLFMKTEYRLAEYSRKTNTVLAMDGTPTLFGDTVSFKPYVQTVSTALVYRFNADSIPSRAASTPLYTKAAAAPVNWTGFYLSGGGGYGLWSADNQPASATNNSYMSERMGGRGYFGTVGGGYDWQISPKWVAGLFADAQFGDIKGTIYGVPDVATFGETSNRLNYAAGARVGYLIAPNVLSYVNGGYSHADFSATDIRVARDDSLTGYTVPKQSFDGWFVGGGVENSLDIFGIVTPGWFMKTEYRVAEYGRKASSLLLNGAPNGDYSTTFKPYVQTVSTSLVYRFNWGAPLSAKY